MGAPLSAAAVVNALIFSSFGESSRLWDDYFFPDDGHLQSIKDVPANVSYCAKYRSRRKWEANPNQE